MAEKICVDIIYEMTFVLKYRKEIILIIGNLIAFLIVTSELSAQEYDQRPYIYGKVTTYSGEYTGQIRWSKEEAIWLDLFNAEKVDKVIEVQDQNTDWSLTSIWKDNKSSVRHQFNCQFGDIQEISGISKSRIVLVNKQGVRITLDGSGYNDVGATIYVQDVELGLIKVSWDKIRKIEFFEGKKKGPLMSGEALYGTVSTFRKGDFEGYVIWDVDERLGEDVLDGDTHGDDLSIPFKNIKSIKGGDKGSDVELKSGRTFYLTGSNDVNSGNRGIVVMNPQIGYIEIPWNDFDKVEFTEPKMVFSYSDFKRPVGINAQIYTRNAKSFYGQIVYDLDEFWEYEIIEGMDDKIRYNIPIRNIQSIRPRNDSYSEVKLKNGKELLLGKLRDVTRANAGVLMMNQKDKKSKYIDWDDIEEIIFD